MSLEDGVEIIKKFIKTCPSCSGVYQMQDSEETILYVGKAKNLKNRILSYSHTEKLPNRLKRMVSKLHSIKITITESEVEALLLESNFIKKFKPDFNILLKDDKSFPYILLTKNHDFPRVVKHRGAQILKGNYFGPFASVAAVDEAILMIQKVFQVRNCADSFFSQRKRPCLQYHIKRCTAPCVGFIDQETYAFSVGQAKQFLLGKGGLVQENLAEKMRAASEKEEYEKAALLRDRIRLLTKIQSYQRINVHEIKEADIIAIASLSNKFCVQVFFFRNGQNFGTNSFFLSHTEEKTPPQLLEAFLNQFYEERTPPSLILLNEEPEDFSLIREALKYHHKKATAWEIPKKGIKKELVDHALHNALGTLRQKEEASAEKVIEELKTYFQIDSPINRIEIYDNSHLQGTDPFGVMVVATQEGFDKKSYRKFKIKNEKAKGNDIAMMEEVITRRFQRHDNWLLPDLLLIDGGMGQINQVIRTLKNLDLSLPVIGIAKGPKRNAGEETLYQQNKPPLNLQKTSSCLYFLQRIRDEAHRFAISSHRASRKKKLSKSILDDIPGIGTKRKKALLNYFGSSALVSRAGIEDLKKAPGISNSVAHLIYNFFHESNNQYP